MDQTIQKILNVAIAKAEVKAKGTCTPPPLNLDAIKERAENLDSCGQTKTDIYGLIVEVKRLRKQLSKDW